MPGFNMDDYVPVNERIDAFKGQYPEGCLQSEIVELTEARVTVRAFAYRTPDDARPGIGHSSLEIPGKTTFTRGSEIENAETSAWGRAIVALGFETKRGIASAEEVRNKQPGQGASSDAAKSDERRAVGLTAAQPAKTPAPAPAQYRRQELAELMVDKHLDIKAVESYADLLGIKERPMSDASMDRLIEAVRGHGLDEPLVIESAAGTAEPEAASVPDAAPAEPPKPGTDAYKALPVPEKAKARAYWAEKEAEERQPEPVNPEQDTLELAS